MGMYSVSTVIQKYKLRVVDGCFGHLKKAKININADKELAYAAQLMARRFTIKPTVMDKASTKVGNKVISFLGNNGQLKDTKNLSLFICQNQRECLIINYTRRSLYGNIIGRGFNSLHLHQDSKIEICQEKLENG